MKKNYKDVKAFLLKIKRSKKITKDQKRRAINALIKMYKIKNRYYNERIGFYEELKDIHLGELFNWEKTIEGVNFWKFINENI